jgi:hypothetical protein
MIILSLETGVTMRRSRVSLLEAHRHQPLLSTIFSSLEHFFFGAAVCKGDLAAVLVFAC